MLKVLIILLLVFCVLSLYSRKTKGYLKKFLIIGSLLIVSMITSKLSVLKVLLNGKLYLACSYSAELQKYASYAQDSMRDYGAYASLILAQIILESEFGKHSSTFGVKVPGASCKTDADKKACKAKGGECLLTTEEEPPGSGIKIKTVDCFKKDNSSLEQKIYNQGKFLTQQFGNRRVFNSATTLEEQLKSLTSNPEARYATSSDYLCKLIDNINSCDLTQYDVGISGGNITGSHLGTLSKDGCSDNQNNNDDDDDDDNGDTEEPFYGIPSKLHFTTSYGGDITQGWLYLRTKAYEDPMNKYYVGADILDDAIDEIFYRARLAYTAENTYGGNKKVKTGMEGKLISGKGVGEEIPDEVLDELGNPLGNQGCNQSSCFGYYSKTNCTSHSGVDLTSSSNATILSAGDGVVKGVSRNNRQCIPNFSKKPICDFASGQCSGNIVTIEHTINGKKWTTKYVHMKSISSSITVGAHVSKGQTIGIIGTTGCSTGIHLHFEIIGPDGKLYNPEQLLANSCNLKAGCDEARQVCK